MRRAKWFSFVLVLSLASSPALASAQETTPWTPTDAASAMCVARTVARDAGLFSRVAPTPDAATTRPIASSTDATLSRGAAALARYRRHLGRGELADAAVALETARESAPSLPDRFALLRADLEMRMGPSRATCTRYESAITSPMPAVSARARLGRVRCLLAIDDRHAEDELASLVRRYRDLPEARTLELEHAAYLARRGSFHEAVTIYDAIDRDVPGAPEAARARAALVELAQAGHRRPTLSATAEIDRLERLARSGPPDLARAEAEHLHALTLEPRLASRVTLVLARLARIEGRFEDASTLITEARTLDPAVGDDCAQVAAQATDLAEAAQGHVVAVAREGMRQLGWNGHTLRRVTSVRVVSMLRLAARAGLRDESTTLTAELAARTSALCSTRFEAAMLASGTATDESIVALLDPCVDGRSASAVASRYHRARALERLGRAADAEHELTAVAQSDAGETRIYAVLARARLEAARPTPAPAPLAIALADHGKEDGAVAVLAYDALATLAALGARHPELPWLARAHDLLALGDRAAASDELYTAYSAWAEALGHSPTRAGVEAVYRNAAAPRLPATLDERRARRLLSDEDRHALADVADAIGDPGLGIRFDIARASHHPRPYSDAVARAAARHGLDPNLLYAVMRVESIYNPRIVSYAGAIGLLQIMPRTGRLIAHNMGNDAFMVDELLDPSTNIEMAAWYLSSLIERFDGRLPLAIAAYNGGPHNVRRWIADHGSAMPIDALCEEIPFTQTHRYVRRVLSHYAAYRAEAGLPPATLDLDQPALGPDTTAF